MLMRQLDMFERGFTCLFSSSPRAAEQTNSRALDNVPPELNPFLSFYILLVDRRGAVVAYRLEKQTCDSKVVGLILPTEKAALPPLSLPSLR